MITLFIVLCRVVCCKLETRRNEKLVTKFESFIMLTTWTSIKQFADKESLRLIMLNKL